MPEKTKHRTKYKSSESESESDSRSDSDSESKYSQSDRSESYSSVDKSPVKKAKPKPKEKETKNKHRTSYQLFCDKERKKIAKEHPTWKLSEMSKELGKRWNALDDKKKRAFARKAAKAKEENA